jgi:hypothetical protein
LSNRVLAVVPGGQPVTLQQEPEHKRVRDQEQRHNRVGMKKAAPN